MPPRPQSAARLSRACRTMLCVVGPLPLLAIVAIFGLRWATDRLARPRTFVLEDVPPAQVALVFGAGVWADGSPSPILRDRIDTAVDLYRAGKVRKLLMTGDNSTVDYNEPQAMREAALARGVPDADIVLDYAGRRTYDSCYRALHIFQVTDAILVTQAYHLDRALFTANGLGLRATGVPADRREYLYAERYWWRELLATPVAWWEVRVVQPLPIMGDPLPIFPEGGLASTAASG